MAIVAMGLGLAMRYSPEIPDFKVDNEMPQIELVVEQDTTTTEDQFYFANPD